MRRLAKAELVILAVSGTPRDLGGKKRERHIMLQEHVLGVVHQNRSFWEDICQVMYLDIIQHQTDGSWMSSKVRQTNTPTIQETIEDPIEDPKNGINHRKSQLC